MPIIKTTNGQAAVEKDSPMVEACESLGIPFGCTSGVCGTCEVKVLNGQNNLHSPTSEEVEFGMDGNRRLCCQMKFSQDGEIEIEES